LLETERVPEVFHLGWQW